MAVAFIPPDVQAIIGDGVFDCTIGFVRVSAIGKTAVADIRPDVAIQGGDFF
jgi:hypothetical protein